MASKNLPDGAIRFQMDMMGWKNSRRHGGWAKFYPPPHEVPNGEGHVRVIARHGDKQWLADLARARSLALEENS